jgi:hypothetical protein
MFELNLVSLYSLVLFIIYLFKIFSIITIIFTLQTFCLSGGYSRPTYMHGGVHCARCSSARCGW